MTMKIHILLEVIGIFLLTACSSARKDSAFYDAGVSKELACHRKKEIKNLRYDLSFCIPKEKEQPINSEITIHFELSSRQEVILDFREESEKLKEIIVNDKSATDFCVENEHIILPADLMTKGENKVYIRFVAGDRSLNRNDEYLYTLLVPDRARTVFPCFEQPNLKARFTLKLEVPVAWKAVSNTYVETETINDDRKIVQFAPTEPLSTYLFSFVAGKLQQQEYTENGRTIAAYYRETDPKKIAQLDIIFKQVMASLRWLEEFTGIPYPFAKYDFIVLPGFQYGGMEHTGATLYNDNRIFLGEHATPDEELDRTALIAHETSHMWFGDLVTMDWFDDVWTKEVFANYFAARISEPLYPKINHQLNKLKTFTASSLSEDRTPGTNAIRQPLDNLRDAGLIYGQIIYNKAPVMMDKLVEIMGEENFRSGIQEYLKTYSYGNATWDDLIHIFDGKTAEDLASFSDVWVNCKGMPAITFNIRDDELVIRQQDPYHRGLNWRQCFNVMVCGERDSCFEVNLADSLLRITLPVRPTMVLPNTDGRGYGTFLPDDATLAYLLNNWQTITDDTARQSLLMTLYENYLRKRFSADAWAGSLLRGLPVENNSLIASTVVSYLTGVMYQVSPLVKENLENEMYVLAYNHKLSSCRLQLIRSFMRVATSEPMVKQLYTLWERQSDTRLSERDYTALCYELAIRFPDKSKQILKTQRKRISNPDRLRQFDFVSRAVVADTLQLDSLFTGLLQAENRQIEPWASAALSYLNHPLRTERAVKYIYPGLSELENVQRTGDIFFPKAWVSALLGSHRSSKAYSELMRFLNVHPDYPSLLKNKIMQAAYPLWRENISSVE